ncbi:MAG TPA: CGNR zinc finger domain-containing protein [Dongiaceae bacterium]|nr:CGNR zinc finger domain-containing protein [Dongiaceae bacterium]
MDLLEPEHARRFRLEASRRYVPRDLLQRHVGQREAGRAEHGPRDGSRDGTGALALQVTRRWRAPDSLLLPIGQAMARFVCDEDFADVKACEGPNCTLMFVDHTRGRKRRWCSMAICGNRTKAAAHRKRLKDDKS